MQDEVHSDKDFFLPFREFAPSRILIRDHENSPFSQHNLHNEHGLFSALIFRGITQSSEALIAGNVLFRTCDAFMELRIHYTESEIAKTTALSKTPNSHRSTDIAPALWNAVVARQETFFSYEYPHTFMNAFNFFRSFRLPKQTRRFKFHGFGPLTAYLITADYAYTELVASPTVEEMAEILCIINRGGLKGLKLLGLLPGNGKPDIQVTTDALRRLYDYLLEGLTRTERETMRFDLIMVEHSLCKLSRLNTKFAIVS